MRELGNRAEVENDGTKIKTSDDQAKSKGARDGQLHYAYMLVEGNTRSNRPPMEACHC